MRLPLRVVGDYHVDRLEVYAQQCVQLTSTNRPKVFLSKTEPKLSLSEKYCGGYSSVDPPLPIPNREVKHTNADGTAPPGGRVGRCRFSDARLSFQPGVFVCNKCSNPIRLVYDLYYPLRNSHNWLIMTIFTFPKDKSGIIFRNTFF